ncbi:MAG: glycerophosphodiester phosphodiesterase family protein [Rhodoglobus sp.]
MATSQNLANSKHHLRARRAALAVTIVTAITLALVLNANVIRVHAVGAFTSLKAPGEAAFVAGHRGDATVAPENTLEALTLALDSAADYVETDVQLTADGVPVLMHDWTVDRTTNGTGPVWTYTYEELSALDAGSWFGDDFAGATVPSLEQFLNVLRWSTKNAILELKGSWTDEHVALVADLIARNGVANHVILGSFDIMTLQAVQRVSPELPGMLIVRDIVGDPAQLAAAAGAVALVTSKKAIMRNPELVQQVHDAGLGILIYTLNDSDTWSDAVALGVDGIVTDRPAELGTWIAKEVSDRGTLPFAPQHAFGE